MSNELVVRDPGLMAGVLDNIPSMRVFGLHIGDAFKGTLAAGVADAATVLIIRFVPGASKFPAWIWSLVAAFLVQWGPIKRFLGADAANVASLILTVEGIARAFPVRQRVSGLLGGILGNVLPAKTTTQTEVATEPTSGMVNGWG